MKFYDGPILMNIDLNTAMDVEQLLNGGFKPLSTFLNFEQLDSVLKKMRLPTGEIWPIPVLFPKPSESTISTGMTLLLKFRKQNLAKLKVTNIFEYNLKKLIKLFYGTNDIRHPGVLETKKSSNIFLTGKLTRVGKLTKILGIPALEPDQVKKIIQNKGWKKVVGFHTRNPPHRAHEFLQKNSLENSDGILIHPVVGSKKIGDFSNDAITRSYKLYIKNYLPAKNVIFTSLLTYSRYAGPREAIFTAIVRRNYGCSHFIVGRDHTGVKDFYGKYDSQKIFSKFKDARIEILCFNEPYYCKKCDQITTTKTCPHRKKYHLEISGTRIRKAILNKSKIPEIYIRKDVLKKLQNTRDIFVNRQEKIEK